MGVSGDGMKEDGGGAGGGKMYQHQYCSELRVKDLNEHLMCVLCGGYFIDATTIIECLHSFCRTCIVRYLESSKYCPICDVQVHKTRPLLNIRADKTLQDLVYKLIPGLFDEEMRRRREFLKDHPEIKTNHMDLEQRGHALMVPVHSMPNHHISLVLHMATPGVNAHFEMKAKRSTARSKKSADRRYLLCPSNVTVGILKKFLRCKFNLSDKHQMDVFYTTTEEIISDEFTLLDITFIYSWTREKPLRLFYTVYEKPRRKRRLADRLLKMQMSPAKKARVNQPTMNGSTARPLYVSPLNRPSAYHRMSWKKSPVGRHVSKLAHARSYHRPKSKVKINKTEFWKTHPRETIKAKRKALETVKKACGRKAGVPAVSVPTKSDLSQHDLQSTNVKNGVSSKYQKNGFRSKVSSSWSETKDNVLETKISSSSERKPNASVQASSLQGKENTRDIVSATNGVYRSTIRTSMDSRGASPKLSTPSSSRSASPRVCTASSGKTDRCDSPLLDRFRSLHAKDAVRNLSGKDEEKVAIGRDRGYSRSNGTSRLPDLHQAFHGDILPTLPLEQNISVNVNMTASTSETSSDVTSPGADDRANSGSLEEPGEFDGGARHVCSMAVFSTRSLPAIMHMSPNGHRQCLDKESGRKQSVDRGNGHKPVKSSCQKQNTYKDCLEKGNAHELNLNKGNKYKQNGNKQTTNRNNGHKEITDKGTGRKQGVVDKASKNGSVVNKHGSKQSTIKGTQSTKASKASHSKPDCTASSNKKR